MYRDELQSYELSNDYSMNHLQENSYESIEAYIEALLQEANLIIIKIDNGDLSNTRENRNFATWRLKRVEKQLEKLDNKKYKEYRAMLNSLWSHLYRLEHTKGDTHPLIAKIRKSYCENDLN